MEADLPIIAPTYYDLSGRNIHISYSTTGVDSQPHFTYQDLQQTRSFSGDLKWRRLFGQKFVFVKWCLAKIGLSTATLAAPCIGQERAAGG